MRLAIVTGAARGMGRAHVRGLVRDGWRVAALDNDAEALGDLGREAAAEGLAVETLHADVRDEAAVTALVGEIERRHGPVEALVNNAGGALGPQTLAQTSLAQWDDTLRLNLTSQFLMIRAVLPGMMAARAGRIVNIATASAFSGITAGLYKGEGAGNLVAYVAAKGGVIGLTHALARELGPFDITVNAVAPGFTPTERVRAKFPAQAIDRMVADQALARLQAVEDATGAVVFLLSEGARFVTGQVIRVDGGGSMG